MKDLSTFFDGAHAGKKSIAAAFARLEGAARALRIALIKTKTLHRHKAAYTYGKEWPESQTVEECLCGANRLPDSKHRDMRRWSRRRNR